MAEETLVSACMKFMRCAARCTEPQTKKVKETKWDWEIVNEVKAIWLRSPKEVSEDEYSKFYHTLAKVTLHFSS